MPPFPPNINSALSVCRRKTSEGGLWTLGSSGHPVRSRTSTWATSSSAPATPARTACISTSGRRLRAAVPPKNRRRASFEPSSSSCTGRPSRTAGITSRHVRTLYDGRYLSALGNLVVVVPNYRVGPLGFLSSRVGTSLPGNLGLHDQRLALEWTRANIDSFGGSALHLVLAGHDAGATSLGYHLFSGDTTFWTQNVDRFILQSGGPFHSYEGQNVEGARQLIASLRCPGDISSEVTLGCLQRAHVDAIARSPMAPSFVPVFGREPLPRPQPLEARNTSAQVRERSRDGTYQLFLSPNTCTITKIHFLNV
ncbi:bile salt-activated lipase-like [Dermacentor silvarum]|uniref:bile salt-activated lipase-like n=1 Tax=Dermacentor silvarum TaxID=543639 RepID=UPI0021017BE0|nr:bile salt-activated lipase-like [Dermacentor silvarum]